MWAGLDILRRIVWGVETVPVSSPVLNVYAKSVTSVTSRSLHSMCACAATAAQKSTQLEQPSPPHSTLLGKMEMFFHRYWTLIPQQPSRILPPSQAFVSPHPRNRDMQSPLPKFFPLSPALPSSPSSSLCHVCTFIPFTATTQNSTVSQSLGE